jgi:hypothetical protein
MKKEEFKKRWESDDTGGGITMDDVADCYVEWGLGTKPRIRPMDMVLYRVVKHAGIKNAKEYEPTK